MPPRGLVNAGNTCFTNVILQALLAVKPFRRLLLALRDVPDLPMLIGRFVRLAVEMGAIPPAPPRRAATEAPRANGNGNGAAPTVPPASASAAAHSTAGGSRFQHMEPLLPDWFDGVFPCSGVDRSVPRNNRLRSRQGSQEDAEEYLSFILNKLHEELIAERPALDDAFFVDSPPIAGPTSAASEDDARARNGIGAVANGNGYLNGHAVGNVRAGSQKSTDDDDDEKSSQEEEGAAPARATFAAVASRGGGGGMKASSVGNGNQNGLSGSAAKDQLSDNLSASTDANTDDGVWEEMTRNGKTVEVRNADLEQSPITEIFGGIFRSSFKRPKAKVSITREPFLSLSLDIDNGMVLNLETSLTDYFRPEQLEGYTLEASSEAVEARKHVQLEELPQVLILHLKRFSHNMQTGALTKVSRRLDFPEYLEVPHQLLALPKKFPLDGDRMYRLTAVVTHIGKELAGGHYTCDVRRDSLEDKPPVWTTCDDSKVTTCDLQQVLKKQAYLLVYSKEDAACP